MASVASLVSSNGLQMDFINYDNYKENNKEFLRGDLWELKVTAPPKIVYYPGDDIFNKRLQSVQVGLDYSVIGIEKQMRGNYAIYQQADQSTYGTLTLTFTDREDQAITYFAQDWRNKVADPDCKYSFRKDDLVMDCELHITNSSRIDVRVLKFFNCQITDAQYDESGAPQAGVDRADVTIGLRFEHYSRSFENI